MNSGASERQAVSAPIMAPIVLLLQQIQLSVMGKRRYCDYNKRKNFGKQMYNLKKKFIKIFPYSNTNICHKIRNYEIESCHLQKFVMIISLLIILSIIAVQVREAGILAFHYILNYTQNYRNDFSSVTMGQNQILKIFYKQKCIKQSTECTV